MDSDKRRVLEELGRKFEKFLPDETVMGQPFWGLMEAVGKKVTGSYYVIPEMSDKKLPLFLSKGSAQNFLSSPSELERSLYVVRGFNKDQIRMLTAISEEDRISFMVFDESRTKGLSWGYRNY